MPWNEAASGSAFSESSSNQCASSATEPPMAGSGLVFTGTRHFRH